MFRGFVPNFASLTTPIDENLRKEQFKNVGSLDEMESIELESLKRYS